jgi:hypothetical protein
LSNFFPISISSSENFKLESSGCKKAAKKMWPNIKRDQQEKENLKRKEISRFFVDHILMNAA